MGKYTYAIVVTLLALAVLFLQLVGCTASEQQTYNTDLAYKIAYYQNAFGTWAGDNITNTTSTNLTGILIGDSSLISTIAKPTGTVVGTSDSQVLTSKTLTSPIINGTVTTTGLTLPSFTLTAGGTIQMNSGILQNLYYLGGRTDQKLGIYGKRQNDDTTISFYTPGVSPTYTDTVRLNIYGRSAEAYISWYNSKHTGFKLGSFLNANTNHLQYEEMSAPGAGSENTTRVYATTGGDTLTDLCAVFQDGTVDIFAQESTELDAPIFTYSSGTEVKVKLIKEHAGLVQFVAEFPNGETFVLKEYEYHDEDKINANKGVVSLLPKDWLIESKTDREARLEKEKIELEKALLLKD